jgi:hypothetical protein
MKNIPYYSLLHQQKKCPQGLHPNMDNPKPRYGKATYLKWKKAD